MRGRGGGDRDVEDDFEREDVGVREEDLGDGDLREGGGGIGGGGELREGGGDVEDRGDLREGDIGGGGDLREGGKDIGGGGDL